MLIFTKTRTESSSPFVLGQVFVEKKWINLHAFWNERITSIIFRYECRIFYSNVDQRRQVTDGGNYKKKVEAFTLLDDPMT